MHAMQGMNGINGIHGVGGANGADAPDGMVLMITGIIGAESCAATVGRQLGMQVELARNRRAALAVLRRREYGVVVLDDGLAEADPAGAEMLWEHSGLALPVQINFAISGADRVVREVRAALNRRAQEKALAIRAATCVMESELNSTVTGLLLHTQLALAEPALTPELSAKLRLVVELAGNLRNRLQPNA